jgi:hypothetical protein
MERATLKMIRLPFPSKKRGALQAAIDVVTDAPANSQAAQSCSRTTATNGVNALVECDACEGR